MGKFDNFEYKDESEYYKNMAAQDSRFNFANYLGCEGWNFIIELSQGGLMYFYKAFNTHYLAMAASWDGDGVYIELDDNRLVKISETVPKNLQEADAFITMFKFDECSSVFEFLSDVKLKLGNMFNLSGRANIAYLIQGVSDALDLIERKQINPVKDDFNKPFDDKYIFSFKNHLFFCSWSQLVTESAHSKYHHVKKYFKGSYYIYLLIDKDPNGCGVLALLENGKTIKLSETVPQNEQEADEFLQFFEFDKHESFYGFLSWLLQKDKANLKQLDSIDSWQFNALTERIKDLSDVLKDIDKAMPTVNYRCRYGNYKPNGLSELCKSVQKANSDFKIGVVVFAFFFIVFLITFIFALMY